MPGCPDCGFGWRWRLSDGRLKCRRFGRRWRVRTLWDVSRLECDETTFGGVRKGKRGRGAAGKVIVFGIVKRNGLVKAQPIPAHDRASIMAVSQTESREGSLYYTDNWQTYAALRLRGDHVVIRKEKGWPVGRDHINGIESFWSYAKNWLYPYRGVPKKFFHLYLGETCYRFNADIGGWIASGRCCRCCGDPKSRCP